MCQSESAACIHAPPFPGFPSRLGPCRALSRFPRALSGLSSAICFIFFFNFILLLFFFICGGFCHTLKWNSQGFTCVPHPNPPSHLPLHPFPLGFPSAPGPSACLMHPTWAGAICFINSISSARPSVSASHPAPPFPFGVYVHVSIEWTVLSPLGFWSCLCGCSAVVPSRHQTQCQQ